MPKFKKLLKRQNLFLMIWFVLAGAILTFEYLTGPTIRFSLAFIIPVLLAARFNGLFWGLAFATFMPALQFVFAYMHSGVFNFENMVGNAAIRIITLALFAFLIDRVTQQARVIRVLKGFLPTCSFCKKIRNENNRWEEMEHYIVRHSEAEFSHTFCPECGKRHYGKYADDGGDPSHDLPDKDQSAKP
jgi:hypothetical protein